MLLGLLMIDGSCCRSVWVQYWDLWMTFRRNGSRRGVRRNRSAERLLLLRLLRRLRGLLRRMIHNYCSNYFVSLLVLLVAGSLPSMANRDAMDDWDFAMNDWETYGTKMKEFGVVAPAWKEQMLIKNKNSLLKSIFMLNDITCVISENEFFQILWRNSIESDVSSRKLTRSLSRVLAVETFGLLWLKYFDSWENLSTLYDLLGPMNKYAEYNDRYRPNFSR